MVPVARRNVFQDRARLFISIGGIAFAMLLVLALDGIVAGSLARIVAYINSTGADVYVAQAGVKTMHMSSSALSLSKVGDIERLSGVSLAKPILYSGNFVVAGEKRVLAYVIGFDEAGGLGGPWKLDSGAQGLGRGEMFLDSTAAGKLGVGIGDDVLVMGTRFRIRGLSADTSNITSSMAFIRFDDFGRLLGTSDTASYILVWLDKGSSAVETTRLIRSKINNVEVMTRAEFAGQEGRLVRDMSAEILAIMNSIGFIIGLAAAALTTYTATLAKRREYGVLKAVGASQRWLYQLAVTQAAWAVGIGAVAAVVMALALAAILSVFVPETPIIVEPQSVFKVFAAAGIISLISAIIPIAQISRIDPAAVFRR